jgi:hypothetical protein
VFDFLTSGDPGVVIPIVTLSLVAVCLLAPVVAICWYKIHKTTATNALKQDMLNRGMSAEEIKTVLDAGSRS